MEKVEIFERVKKVHELIYSINVSKNDVIRMANALMETQCLLEEIAKDENIKINYKGDE